MFYIILADFRRSFIHNEKRDIALALVRVTVLIVRVLLTVS